MSLNGQQWQAVFPTDGIFDASTEAFEYVTEELEPGEYVFVFVATDAAGNVGSAKCVIRVPDSDGETKP